MNSALQEAALQFSALREAADLGADDASEALSQLMGRHITVSVTDIKIAPLAHVYEVVRPSDEVVSTVTVHTPDELLGQVLVLLPERDAEFACEMISEADRGTLSPVIGAAANLRRARLTQVGHILGGAYLNALAQFVEAAARSPETIHMPQPFAAVLTSQLGPQRRVSGGFSGTSVLRENRVGPVAFPAAGQFESAPREYGAEALCKP